MKQERNTDFGDRLEQLFHAAAELPPGERAEFLDRHCGNDHNLRSLLEVLLTADQREMSAVDTPLMQESDTQPVHDRESATLPRGHRIASYEVVRPIASG